jgi:hypothetical protein
LVIIAAGVIAACSDSSGPSSFACTGGTPNLAGAWSLYSINQGTGALTPPAAHGSFNFVGDSVLVSITVPIDTQGDTVNLNGAGKCTLTSKNITITNFAGQGDAVGPYTFKAGPPDTLTASVVNSNITTVVVITRP